MFSNRKIILVFMVLIIIGIAVYSSDIRQAFFDYTSGVDRAYYEKMESITMGMTKSDVINLLGEPDDIIKDKEIVQTHGTYGSGPEYGTKIINKNECLYYYRGVDIIGAYCVDENEKVYFINVGGT